MTLKHPSAPSVATPELSADSLSTLGALSPSDRARARHDASDDPRSARVICLCSSQGQVTPCDPARGRAVTLVSPTYTTAAAAADASTSTSASAPLG